MPLDWLNKGDAVKTARYVPYRLLQGVKSLSYGGADSENMLIQGDNLEALKALLPVYAGKVQSEVHLPRPALQHQIGLRTLRRQSGA